MILVNSATDVSGAVSGGAPCWYASQNTCSPARRENGTVAAADPLADAPAGALADLDQIRQSLIGRFPVWLESLRIRQAAIGECAGKAGRTGGSSLACSSPSP